MADYSPITLRAVDDKQNVLFEYVVPFEFGITAKQLLERAFVLAQTGAKADPFVYTIEYFGYSESAQFPGYLGTRSKASRACPTTLNSFGI
jgi:hypothetical protein